MKIQQIYVQSEFENYTLKPDGGVYRCKGISVRADEGRIFLDSPKNRVERVIVEYDCALPEKSKVLCDTWERSYGDLQWKDNGGEFIAPWYFLCNDGARVCGFGVKTQPNAICYWKYAGGRLQLICDVRCGSVGVRLSEELFVAETVFENYTEEPFTAAQKFCRAMCGNAIFPKSPVYGGNDWYCNYGNNSYDKIIDHAKIIAECSEGLANRPYMVIDAGWQLSFVGQFTNVEIFNGGPWRYCNSKFGDMKKLADEIKSMGVKPGIWCRPLLTMEYIPDEYYIKDKNGNKFEDSYMMENKIHRTMDPSEPYILKKIADDITTLKEWGYELIKFDFTTFDMMRRMGMYWGEEFTENDWTFGNSSKTTAMVIKNMYKTIKEAAGDDVVIIGCNTIGHLGAGFFELQRTGGDTSGMEWDRTRRMGVNTLAFRMPQHGNFYHIDADCVGITKDIDWNQNRQWLELLSVSGTPLFVSVASDAYTDEVRKDITEAFKKSAENITPAQPLDWETELRPQKWKTSYGIKNFDWYINDGN